jgi:LMBR1 domain-containing protein 1
MATMTGIITMGVRFLWVQLYRIQKRATAPQGLMCCTILLTLSLLALNYTLTAVVAPGYSHFGSQVYVSSLATKRAESIVISYSLVIQCNSTMDPIRHCSGKPDLIVPCDIYAPTGKTRETINEHGAGVKGLKIGIVKLTVLPRLLRHLYTNCGFYDH